MISLSSDQHAPEVRHCSSSDCKDLSADKTASSEDDDDDDGDEDADEERMWRIRFSRREATLRRISLYGVAGSAI